MSRYINVSKLPNYTITADAKCGPITEKVNFVMLPYKHISEIPDAEEEIIDQIASFFEKEENWLKLRECWLECWFENGYSHDFRRLLRKALEEE